MAQNVIGALMVSLGLDSAQYTTGLKRAQGEAVAFQGKLGPIGQALSQMAGIGKTFAIGLGAGLATAGLSNLGATVRGVVADLGGLQDAADRIGLGTEDLQGLQAGFKLAGVDIADTNSALEIFAERLGSAAEGQGALAPILKRAGIALRDQRGEMRPTLDLLRDLAALMQAAGSEQERLALAQDAFGKGGRSLVLALQGGPQAVDEIIRSAREAGLVLDESLVKRAAELDDKFDLLTMRVAAWAKATVIGAADVVAGWTEAGTAAEHFTEAFSPEEQAKIEVNVAAEIEAQPALDAIAALRAEAGYLVMDLGTLSAELRQTGQADQAEAFRAMAVDVDGLNRDLDAGVLDAARYGDALAGIQERAGRALSNVAGLDGVRFGGVIAGAASLGQALADLEALGGAAGDAVVIDSAPAAAAMAAVEAEARQLVTELVVLAATLRETGQTDAAAKFESLALEVDDLTRLFKQSAIGGDVLTDVLKSIATRAADAGNEVASIDTVSFDNVISRLGGVGSALATIISLGAQAAAAVAGAAAEQAAPPPLTGPAGSPAGAVAEAARSNAATETFLRQQRELNSLSAAELALRRETAQVQEQAAEAGAALSEQEARAVAVAAAAADAIRNAGSRRSDKGGGGGGGGGGRSAAPRADAYAEMVAETRAATEATFEYGRAAEVAALRQDLLVAAQKSGRDITPELTAETEELADAYVSAMERADALTETMDGLKDAGRSAFVGLLKDGKSLKEGLADLFDDLATQLAGSISTVCLMGAAWQVWRRFGWPGAWPSGGRQAAHSGVCQRHRRFRRRCGPDQRRGRRDRAAARGHRCGAARSFGAGAGRSGAGRSCQRGGTGPGRTVGGSGAPAGDDDGAVYRKVRARRGQFWRRCGPDQRRGRRDRAAARRLGRGAA
jgi:hypothetical protein